MHEKGDAMLARTGFSIIELCLVVSIVSIIAAMAIPNYMAMQQRAKEANVIALAHVVQTASEDYAVKSLGVYSDREEDIRPCLPGGQLQPNAFTGDRTEPRFGSPADGPGQVGLEVFLQSGAPTSYVITCFGSEDILLTYTGGH